MKRTVYLDMQTLAQAQQRFWTRFAGRTTAEETVDSHTACGRVTSRPVFARLSSPSFHAAAMDGLAVQAEDTFGASDHAPVSLDIQGGQAVFINTGHPLPPDKNAVIMIEHVLLSKDRSQGIIRAPVYPWQHVRKVGEDIVATELLFPGHHLLRPADLAALLTSGCGQVHVFRRPRVTIIPTGSELVPVQETAQGLSPGKTIESNSAMLAALARVAGGQPTVTPIIPDEYDAIRTHVEAAIQGASDIIVINAGSSAGSADYTVQVIEELGEVLVHGVTIMPGKPTILGVIQDKPVIGNPGYPVSALISFEQFVAPLLHRMQGLEPVAAPTMEATLARDLPSRAGMEEFRRMVTGRIGSDYVTLPLKKGAGAITTLTRANTILRMPASSEGISQGSRVRLELLRPQVDIDRTILCTGSHDLCLELLHDFLKRSQPAWNLASTHVGSLGGIFAIRDQLAHVAGSHLLDPASGIYNLTYLDHYLKEVPVALITLVHRQQGLMVAPGNPKKINGIEDLARKDITFVNRQAGSGTRVLFDYELARLGLNRGDINGYTTEEYTHMGVGAAVLSGKSDVGLGILAAARALGLDFLPVTEERYDLLIPEPFLKLPMIQALLDIVNNVDFQHKIEALGGYSTRETGRRQR